MHYVEQAEEAIGKRKWPLAIAYLQEAMQSEPGNPQNILLLSNMGMLQYYNGEDSLALRTLTEARAMAPASVVILANRAEVLTGMGRYDDALADYTRIIGMDSTYAAAWLERGAIELRQGKLAEAEGDIARLRELRPGDRQGSLCRRWFSRLREGPMRRSRSTTTSSPTRGRVCITRRGRAAICKSQTCCRQRRILPKGLSSTLTTGSFIIAGHGSTGCVSAMMTPWRMPSGRLTGGEPDEGQGVVCATTIGGCVAAEPRS